jgi:outer membrane protein OmpA-like peptidoglycan-associated protein
MKSYKLSRVLFISLLFFSQLFQSYAQDFLPTLNDNYMGINQVLLQPASIVDSRFRVDVNVFGYSSEIYTNMVSFNGVGLLRPNEMVNDDEWWNDNVNLVGPNGDPKSGYVNADILGPSVLVTINAKHAIGFTSRIRQVLSIDDIDETLIMPVYDEFNEDEFYNKWYHAENIRSAQNIFADYGLSYATEVYNKGAHYVKAGITVKLLQGLGGAYIKAEDLYYYVDENGVDGAVSISWNSDHVQYGASDNWDWQDDDNGINNTGFRYNFIANPTVGLDIGGVYEFRPKYKDYLYNMDGETGLVRKDLNKYFLKIGVSVLDIGRLRYKKAYGSKDFVMNQTPDAKYLYDNQINDIPANTHWMNMEEITFRFPPYVDLSDTINNRIATNTGWSNYGDNNDYFDITLPTAVSLQADINVVKGFYVNLTTYTALHTGENTTGNAHYTSNYSLTPRYEHKWFSVMLPMSYGEVQKFNVGLGLRAGFIYMGINNIISGLISDPYGSSFYIGAKIPIFQEKPPSDRDNDGVSDEKDRCIDVAGTWENMGCPDRDGDGVVDIDDLCPDIFGLKIYQGCPDRDGDEVPDYQDDCPDVPGPKLTKGCPDRDGDGVVDNLDECPDVPGPASLNGCPDRDGDMVVDYKDNCPDEPGPPEQGGCPFVDTDKDGIKDPDDRCPEIPGPPENFGCPYTDTDGDGVIDRDDKCPLTPGDIANAGCPVIKVEEAAVLKTAFENLEFETGKSVIKASSFASLDELATLLISKSTWKLMIAGHTDNVGSEESNLTLSKNRTQAVGKYLQGKGVPASQLDMQWYGETRPMADNATPEGRQKNRRVEMQIEFN